MNYHLFYTVTCIYILLLIYYYCFHILLHHCIAEIYNETYLVTAFGFLDEIRPAPSLSILNISNPFNPQWVISFPALSNGDNNSISGLSSGTIAAIIVPIVILILVIYIYIFSILILNNNSNIFLFFYLFLYSFFFLL